MNVCCPPIIRRRTNVVLMLVHRLRRWLAITTTLGVRLSRAGVIVAVQQVYDADPNNVLMLVHHLRRWPNIRTIWVRRRSPAGVIVAVQQVYGSHQCCSNVRPPSATLARHYNNIGWMSVACWVDGSHLFCACSMRSRQLLQTVWEQWRSLGMCSCPS